MFLSSRRRAHVAALLLSTVLVTIAPALAQDAMDTTLLPRMPGAKEIYASALSTIFTSPENVAATAASLDAALAAQGWQRYVAPFTEMTKDPSLALRSLKKGGIGLSVFITVAPAQNNATSVQYGLLKLDADLPFPKDAADIEFDPHRPYLKCLTAMPVGEALAFFREELAAQSWVAESSHPGGAASAGELAQLKAGTRAQDYFVDPKVHALSLSLQRALDGRTQVEIKVVPANTLPRLKPPPVAVVDAPGAKADTSALTTASEIDVMTADMKKQIEQMKTEALAGVNKPPPPQAGSDAPIQPMGDNPAPVPVPANAEGLEFAGEDGRLEFTSSSSVKALAGFYRAAMKPLGWKEKASVINRPNMVVLDFSKSGKVLSFTILQMGAKANVSAHGSGLVSGEAAAPAAPADDNTVGKPAEGKALEAQDADAALPIPVQHSSSGNSQTPFRVEANASVPASLETVLAFYRSELGKRGWKEGPDASVKPDKASVAFTAPGGPAVLKLARAGGETTVSLALRKQAEAQKAGLLPKAGQVTLILGNMLETDSVITINKKTVKVSAKTGAKGTDGPRLELAPGTYVYAIKSAGKPAQRGDIEVSADEIWGVLIGPGGGLPLQLY